MATVIWNGAGSTNNWDNTNNWDSTSLPTSSDDVLFNSTSTKDCTVNLSPFINSLTIDTSFSGKWLLTGYDLTTAVGFTDNGNGAKNYGNSIKVTGNGPFHVGSTAGSITASNCSVYLQGNNNLDCSKAITFLNLELAYPDKTTNNSSSSILTLSDGTFHLHGGRYANGAQSIYCNCSTLSNPLIFDTSSSASGSTSVYVRPFQPITVNIPALPSNWFIVYFQGNNATGTATININADLTASYFQMLQNSTGTLTVNTNNKGIFGLGGYLYSGSNNASGIFNLNCGSSTLTFSGSVLLGLYSAGSSNYDLGTSNWTIAGALTLVANNTLTNTTTSSMSFTTSLDSTITSVGKTLPALTVNKTSGGVRFSDNLVCKSLAALSSNASSLITASADITSNGNVIFDGVGGLTLNGRIRLLGDGTCRFASSLNGAMSVASCDIEFDGTTGSYLTDNKSVSLKTLYLGPNSIVTNSGTGSTKFQNTSTPLIMDTSSRLIMGSTGEIRSVLTSASSFYSQAAGSVISGANSNVLRLQAIANGITCTLPSLKMDGTGIILNMYDGNGRFGCTYQLSGNIDIGSNALYTSVFGSSPCDMTFNGNGYDVTCGEFRPGCNSAAANTSTVLMGSGTYKCSSYTSSYDYTSSIINFQTSNWVCSGNFTTGTNHVISMGSLGSIKMTGASSILTFSATSAGSISIPNMDVTVSNTSGLVSIKDNKGISLKSLVLSSSAIATNSGSSVTTYSGYSVPLSLNSNSRLTLSRSLILRPLGTLSTAYSCASDATIGLANSYLGIYSNNNGTTIQLPFLDMTGASGSPQFDLGAQIYDTTFNVTGNLYIPSVQLFTRGSTNGKTTTFNFSSGGSFVHTINNFNVGNNAGTNNYNFGDSTFNIGSFTGSTYVLGTTNLNYQSATINCTGSWANGSTHSVDPGTSQVTFSGTAASVVTSATKSFYDIIVNNASKAFSFADSASFHNLTTTAMASYTNTGTSISSSGAVTFNGTGTLNLGTDFTLSGSASSISLNSTLGAVTASSCVLTVNGNNCTLSDNKGVSWKQVTLGTGAKLTASGSQNLIISGTVTALNIGNNATLTNNMPVIIYPNASMNVLTFGSGAVWNGSSAVTIRGNSTPITLTLPVFSYTGLGAFTINDNSAITMTTNFTGTTNFSGNLVFNLLSGSTLTYNTNDNSIGVAGALVLGSNGSTFLTANFGNSPITIGSFDGSTYNGSGTRFNMQGSQWICLGNWTNGSAHTITHWWDTVTMAGSSDSTIISAGKKFNNLVINSPNKTVYLSDPTIVRGYQVVNGNFNKDDKITVNNDIVAITDFLSY